jgi:hypothetical protein
MPEALAIFIVSITCALVYAFAWSRSRNPAEIDTLAELKRLEIHQSWLQERLERAKLEQWHQAMIASISAELAEATIQLARARNPVATR